MSYGHNGGPPLDGGLGADGWIAVARRMRSHWLVGFGHTVEAMDPSRGAYSRAEAWLDLIMECRYSSGTVTNGGRRMELRPGQLVGATSWLASRWNWTPKTTRTFLDKLENDGMIERFSPGTAPSPDESHQYTTRGIQKGKQASIITICNYDAYQIVDDATGQATGQAKGEQGASKGQAEGNIYKEETREQGKQGNKKDPTGSAAGPAEQPAQPPAEQSTPTLSAEEVERLRMLADPEAMAMIQKALAEKARKAERAEQTRLENERQRTTAESAYSLYNKAAVHFGFAMCESMTDKRTAKLLKRIADIGGLENFRQALRAIGRDDFLAGRVAKPGQKPFKLDFDRLLSTDSGLGDVLARLIDLSSKVESPQDMASPNGKIWGWWRPDVEKLRVLKPDYWQRRFDALKPNGTWPWWELGPPPGHAEALIDWDTVIGTKLSEVYRGEVEHA